jgi:phage terminase small subunit
MTQGGREKLEPTAPNTPFSALFLRGRNSMSEILPLRAAKAAPPGHLSAESRKFWARIVEDYSVHDPAGLELLREACECLDGAADCRRAIKQDALTLPGSRHGSRRPHPLLRVESEYRRGFLACVRALSLDPNLPPLRGRTP